LKQERVVRRLALSSAVQLRPARREHARRSLQRIDLEPRVLGERRQVRPLREVTGLRHRVLAEARPLLQLALLREPLEKLVRRKHELEREPGERLADLPRFAVVPSRNEQLHIITAENAEIAEVILVSGWCASIAAPMICSVTSFTIISASSAISPVNASVYAEQVIPVHLRALRGLCGEVARGAATSSCPA